MGEEIKGIKQKPKLKWKTWINASLLPLTCTPSTWPHCPGPTGQSQGCPLSLFSLSFLTMPPPACPSMAQPSHWLSPESCLEPVRVPLEKPRPSMRRAAAEESQLARFPSVQPVSATSSDAFCVPAHTWHAWLGQLRHWMRLRPRSCMW